MRLPVVSTPCALDTALQARARSPRGTVTGDVGIKSRLGARRCGTTSTDACALEDPRPDDLDGSRGNPRATCEWPLVLQAREASWLRMQVGATRHWSSGPRRQKSTRHCSPRGRVMLDAGADVRHVAEMLGHQKLDTTMQYTRVSMAKLQEVHARCHPAEQVGGVRYA
jgi:hypothetical protein